MKLKKKLIQKVHDEIPQKLLPLLPGRIPIIGYAALIRLKRELYPYGHEIGNALISLNNKIESVWTFTGKTKGVQRIPQVQWLAGRKNPIVLHKEYGTLFSLDISRLTFSPGNAGERGTVAKMVKKNQTLVDLFACCGNLTLPAAVNNAIKRIWMVEINPVAYHYLIQNIYLNNLERKAIPIREDNHQFHVKNIGDHVFLGILPHPDHKQLKIGIEATKKHGGWLHYHTSIPKTKQGKKAAKEQVTTTIREKGYHIEKMKTEQIKGISPQQTHIVIRTFLAKN